MAIVPDKWHKKEMELNRRHEAILLQRSTLLHRHKVSLKSHDSKTRKFGKELGKAKERNERFVMELEVFDKKMQKRQKDCNNPEFDILKAKYWEMVSRELSSL